MNKDPIRVIKSILKVNQKKTGHSYLKVVLKNISKYLDVKYAFIRHPFNDDLSLIQTDLVFANGEFIENFTYDLKNTPCEIVLSGERVS